VNTATIDQLQKIVADSGRPERERRQAAEHIINLQKDYAAQWATIPDDDPALVPLMEKVESADYLAFWPEHKNRSLDEAKEIVYLRRIIGDASRSRTERWEAENALIAIRRKLQGGGDQ
jgi:hypothetical protein